MLFSSRVPPVSSAQKLNMSEFTDSLNVMLIGEAGVGKKIPVRTYLNNPTVIQMSKEALLNPPAHLVRRPGHYQNYRRTLSGTEVEVRNDFVL